jgi:hypothetical protein
MSKPTKPASNATTEQLLDCAIHECLDATSSLHMEPEPIPEDQQKDDNNGYLSDTDFWAQHSAEHVYAAVAYIRAARHAHILKRDKIRRLLLRGLKDNATLSDVYESVMDALMEDGQ